MSVPRPEYPRPQFVRPEWKNLNGRWEFMFNSNRQGLRDNWPNGPLRDWIIVPYPYQSELSEVNRKGINEVLWYSRTFTVPSEWDGRNILINFGAVDYKCTVWVNGQKAGHNRGGHVPFSFDITPHLQPGENRVTLYIEDTQDPEQPRGKQAITGTPSDIFYYNTSGIWQTVWLEPVSAMHIENVTITPSVAESAFDLTVYLHAPASSWRIEADVLDGGKVVAATVVDSHRSVIKLRVNIPNARLWSPDDPHLYDIALRLIQDGKVLDEVQTYAGLRSIELRDGHVVLNGEPIYLKMVLDQGYWPESYLTAPTDDALRDDVEWTKKFGFNGSRKHQKVEDPRWLYWCDKLGLLVWGEMANARAWSPEAETMLADEWERAVLRDINHPCIIAWVPVNESMGFPQLSRGDSAQYACVERLVSLTRRLDPERPVIDNDGWEHTDVGDIYAIHDYTQTGDAIENRYKETLAGGPLPSETWIPEKAAFVRGAKYRGQPIMLTEVGGYLMKPNNISKDELDPLYSAYGTISSPEDLYKKYAGLMQGIAALTFVSGFCYTQLTDVEHEMNGLLTYDRKPKVDPELIAKVHEKYFDGFGR